MTTFAEDIAAECVTLAGHKLGGQPIYKFSVHRAELKRASGDSLLDAKLFWMFYLLTKHRRKGPQDEDNLFDESRLFLVATLIAFDTKTLEAYLKNQNLPQTVGNFGATLDKLEKELFPKEAEAKRKTPQDSKRRPSPIERRLLLLLDTRLEPDGTGDLPFRLRQIVRYVLDKGKPFNDPNTFIAWDALLWDLREWDHPDKKRQKEWARSFYGYQRSQEANAEAIENAADNNAADNNDDIDLDED